MKIFRYQVSASNLKLPCRSFKRSVFFLLLGLTSFLSLWTIGVSHASATVLQQLDYSSNSGTTTATAAWQQLGTGISGKLNFLRVYVSASTSDTPWEIEMRCYDDSGYSSQAGCPSPVATYSVPRLYGSGLGLASIISFFSDDLVWNFLPGKYYSFEVVIGDGTKAGTPLGSTATSSFPAGQCVNYGAWQGCGNLKELYFELSAGNETYINVPRVVNGSANTFKDFAYWQVISDSAPTTSDLVTETVYYGNSTSTMTRQSSAISPYQLWNDQVNNLGYTTFNIGKDSLSNGTYSAYAVVYFGGVEQSRSDTITFNIDASSSNTAFNPTMSVSEQYFNSMLENEECPNDVWSNLSGYGVVCQFKKGFKDLVRWLFVPTTGIKNWGLGQVTQFKNVVPFKFVYEFDTNIEYSLNTNTATKTLNVILPSAIGGASIPIFSGTQLSDFTGNDIKNQIFSVEGAAIWIFVAYKMIRVLV